MWLMYVSALVGIAGIAIAYVRYGAAPIEDPDARALGATWRLLNAKYWVDEIYDRVFTRPLRRLGNLCWGTDRNGIEGVVWFASVVPRILGFFAQTLQRGALQGYALAMVAGVALLLILWRYLERATVAG
jgi:NADH-quinone oxidoreductase subunit L